MYCVDMFDKELYLKGSRDDEINLIDHSFIKIIATACTEDTRLKDDPPCEKNQTVIDEYL